MWLGYTVVPFEHDHPPGPIPRCQIVPRVVKLDTRNNVGYKGERKDNWAGKH